MVFSISSSSEEMKKILVIGSGGREHALIYRLRQSPSCEKVFALPGNAGIALEPGVISVADVAESNHAGVVEFCKSNRIDLVVVGPEAPLVDGLADSLRAENINVFGPSKKAAQLEGSKEFMKNLCRKYNIPTATYEVFNDAEKAKEYVRTVTGAPIVIKTSGLAAGKGVIMTETIEEAEKAIDELMLNKQFGDAGDTIVIEETLFGEEASFFAVDTTTSLFQCFFVILLYHSNRSRFDNQIFYWEKMFFFVCFFSTFVLFHHVATTSL